MLTKQGTLYDLVGVWPYRTNRYEYFWPLYVHASEDSCAKDDRI